MAWIALIILGMILWAVAPPIAVGLVLVVGGAWLLVLGLCRVSGDADTISDEALREAWRRGDCRVVTLVDEAYDLNDKEMLDALADIETHDNPYAWSSADQEMFERHASDTRRPFDQEND